jgi:hypothetical protein
MMYSGVRRQDGEGVAAISGRISTSLIDLSFRSSGAWTKEDMKAGTERWMTLFRWMNGQT